MTQATIRKAFETRLKTWADAQTPAIPVAWENVAFTPPAGRYLRAYLLPSKVPRLFLDGTGRTFRGVFQVSFYMPLDKGAGSAESLIASLDAAFDAYEEQDGLRVYLLSPFYPASGRADGDRWVVPASAEYRADTV